MTIGFGDIPDVVIDYIRDVFAGANRKVSTTLTRHPAMHEESLDHLLIAELTATPPTFFAKPKMGVAIESHWLGGRHMYDRWEIADIAVCVTLREHGKLAVRKVALLQTKRLYSKEVHIAELERADFMIGIGRIIDTPDRHFPLSTQRVFSFDEQCVYQQIRSGADQVEHIDAYAHRSTIPVYYGLYNPLMLPYVDFYPITAGNPPVQSNQLGCRVVPSSDIHNVLGSLPEGRALSFNDVSFVTALDGDALRYDGWRLEGFIADEVMRCRQGRLFEASDDPRLQQLLYARSAPISAAIAITIDFSSAGD